MFGFWRQRREQRQIAEADAAALIEGFGAQAYYKARRRAENEGTGKEITDARSPEHWWRVAGIVAKRTGKRVGLDTATRYLEGS